MKNLLTAVLLTLTSSQAFATQADVKFVGVDTTEATNLCLSAAKVGYYKAKKMAKSSVMFNEVEFASTQCNGLPIRQFARKYQMAESTTTEKVISYQFKTVDNTQESQICAVAAKDGLKQALNIGGAQARFIVCNGLRIESFARKFRNS